MGKFWESSPLYQREQELFAELAKVKEARDNAGEHVLLCVRMGFMGNAIGRRDRAAYLAAHASWEDAFTAWREADRAFKASPAGRARARYYADPLAVRLANGAASYAPAEFAEAAE